MTTPSQPAAGETCVAVGISGTVCGHPADHHHAGSHPFQPAPFPSPHFACSRLECPVCKPAPIPDEARPKCVQVMPETGRPCGLDRGSYMHVHDDANPDWHPFQPAPLPDDAKREAGEECDGLITAWPTDTDKNPLPRPCKLAAGHVGSHTTKPDRWDIYFKKERDDKRELERLRIEVVEKDRQIRNHEECIGEIEYAEENQQLRKFVAELRVALETVPILNLREAINGALDLLADGGNHDR